jgi:uncharacterized repeat protein (TIGR03803 family)
MNRNMRFSPRTLFSSWPRKIQPLCLSLLLILTALACHASGQTLTTLHNFGAIKHDGQAPGWGVIIDKDGNLFGTTGTGGAQRSLGTVFELSPPTVPGDPWTETILHRFHGTPDGRNPSQLVMTPDGALAGTTLLGGTNNSGIAYTLSPPVSQGTWKKKIIHNFGSVPDDVVTPNFGFLMEPEGLYGVDQGGANNTGAVYLLTAPARKGAWTQHILYSFGSSQSGDAALPSGELVRDSSGNFYGLTGLGGANNLGAVYRVSPPAKQGGAWTETVLFSFNGTDGTLPAGPLLLGPGGVLYGTTNGGGDSGAGLVFELDPPAVPGNPWTETILHAFTGGNDGGSPENGVLADGNGRLLGTAGQVIFVLTPPQSPGNPWTESVLHTFSGPDGFVTNTLTLSNNALYGTTQLGGAFGHGTVFQLTLP